MPQVWGKTGQSACRWRDLEAEVCNHNLGRRLGVGPGLGVVQRVCVLRALLRGLGLTTCKPDLGLLFALQTSKSTSQPRHKETSLVAITHTATLLLLGNPSTSLLSSKLVQLRQRDLISRSKTLARTRARFGEGSAIAHHRLCDFGRREILLLQPALRLYDLRLNGCQLGVDFLHAEPMPLEKEQEHAIAKNAVNKESGGRHTASSFSAVLRSTRAFAWATRESDRLLDVGFIRSASSASSRAL